MRAFSYIVKIFFVAKKKITFAEIKVEDLTRQRLKKVYK